MRLPIANCQLPIEETGNSHALQIGNRQLAIGNVIIPSEGRRSGSGARLSTRARVQKLFPPPPKFQRQSRWPRAERRPGAASIYSSTHSQSRRPPILQSRQSPSTRPPRSKTASVYSASSRRQLYAPQSPSFVL